MQASMTEAMQSSMIIWSAGLLAYLLLACQPAGSLRSSCGQACLLTWDHTCLPHWPLLCTVHALLSVCLLNHQYPCLLSFLLPRLPTSLYPCVLVCLPARIPWFHVCACLPIYTS